MATSAEIPYDLIIMDINMPVMDGIEASEQIMQHFSGQALPIIFAATGDNPEDYLEKTKQVGISQVIQKPMNVDKMKKLLLEYFD